MWFQDTYKKSVLNAYAKTLNELNYDKGVT